MGIETYVIIGVAFLIFVVGFWAFVPRIKKDNYSYGLGEGPATTMELKNNDQLREVYSVFREKMKDTLSRRFDDIEVIASGGMGIIVSAVEKGTSKKVAIKTISPKLYENPKAIKFFFQECKAIQKMNHPNIIRIYDSADEGFLYYTMEHLQGETLEDLMNREGVLPIDMVVRIGTQVARALEHCHSNGIVHRDIKPSNIFINPKEVCKIIDFGVVQNIESQGIELSGGIGSPYYASPEQVHGRVVTGKSDVFAMGICLFKMLTTVFPYSKSFTDDLNQTPKNLLDLNGQVPQELNNIISDSIRINMKLRISANELWARLRNIKE